MTEEEKKKLDEAQKAKAAEDDSSLEDIKWEIETSDVDAEEGKPIPDVEVAADTGEVGVEPEPEEPFDEFEAAEVEPPLEGPEEAISAEDVPAGGAVKEEPAEVEVGEAAAEEEGPSATEPEQPASPEPPPPPPSGVGYGEAWNWKEDRSGFRPFVFQFMSELYRFSRGRVDRIDDMGSMSGYFTYLAHYEEAPGLGLLTLNTELRYANVLARKRLEELGELTPEGVLKVFASRKLEGGQVSVFYEVLPRDKHVAITETYNSYGPGFIIHDTVSLLYGLLKRAGRGVHAYALHLPGNIVLVAGSNGNVHLTRRYTLVGEDEQAIIEGIHALSQDLQAMERNMGQKLDKVDWIQGLAWDLEIPKPAVEVALNPWPMQRMTLDGQEVWSALPMAIAKSQNAAAIGPKEEMYLRPLEQAEKFIWALLLALAIVAAFGAFSMQGVSSDMQASARSMRSQMNAMEADIQARKVEAEFSALEPTLQLAGNFKQAAVSPPFGEMWNYLASLKPEEIRVDGLDFSYQPESVVLRIEGEVQRDLSGAQFIFNSFLEDLEKGGFNVVSQQLDLDVDGNFYSLNLGWDLKKTE